MPIKPKFIIESTGTIPKTARQFTDRESIINAFQSALENKNKNIRNILVFYGVGGIGKTSLRKELARIIKEKYKDAIAASLDFDLPAFRQEETALYYLRKLFKDDYKINFPSFEIAYAVYWQKTHPQTPINKFNFPLIDESILVSGLISVLGSLPIFGLIPGLTKTALKGHKYFKDWWTKRGQKELYNLSELEAKEILVRLPMFFASDLKDYLEGNNKQCVIFVDSYESLWERSKTESSFFLNDEWVRELVAQLSEPLWVIIGREKLRWVEIDKDWGDCLKYFPVSGLTDSDSSTFLISCGIDNKNLRKTIIESSKGVPYYLDLAVDTYYQIKQIYDREPVTDDFAKTQIEVLERFLMNLDNTEIETLKILSAARMWNSDIFELLVNKINTGYPVTAMIELCRFSFINESMNSDTFTMHDLMREGLQSKLENKTLKDVHTYLFEYYNKKLADVDIKNITNENIEALTEAFYHCKNCCEAQELYAWFGKKSGTFIKANKWKLVIPLLEELAQLICNDSGKNNKYYADILDVLGEGYISIGLFDGAIVFNEQALEIRGKIFNTVHPDYAKSLDNLGKVYTTLGQYNKAIPLHTKALEIRKNTLGENHPDYAASLHNLAVAYSYLSDFKKAIPLYEQSLEVTKKTFGSNSIEFVNTMHSLATIYSSRGHQDKAIHVFENVLNIIREFFGENHPSYAKSLNSLAQAYENIGQYVKAISMFEKTVEIRRNILGENHPNYALSLGSIGGVYYHTGQYEKAEYFYEKALEIMKNAFGENHPECANILNNLAIVYNDTGHFEKSLRFHREALEIRKDTIGKNHQDYASSLNNMAVVYYDMGNYEKSIQLHEEAIEIRKNIFGENHPYYGISLDNLAQVYNNTGQRDKAIALHEKANKIVIKTLGENHPFFASCLNNLANAYSSVGKHNDAIGLYEKALVIMKNSISENHPEYFKSLINLANCYLKIGKCDKSLSLCHRASDVYNELDIQIKPALVDVLKQVIDIYYKLDKIEDAKLLEKKIEKIISVN